MGNKQARKQVEITASKSQSQRVWTSYGVTIQLLSFFYPKEVCEDQLLNKFFYDVAVSRV